MVIMLLMISVMAFGSYFAYDAVSALEMDIKKVRTLILIDNF
jgi:hypothetical protein